MIAYYGSFDDVSAVIDVCPLCSVFVPHVETLKLIIYLVVNLCYGIKDLLLVHCLSLRK